MSESLQKLPWDDSVRPLPDQKTIRGRCDTTDGARTRLLNALRDAMTGTAIETNPLAQVQVSIATLCGEVVDIRQLINSTRIDERIIELLDNRVMERASTLVNECVQKLQALKEYESIVDGKLRLLDEKLDEFRGLWNDVHGQ